MSTQTIPSRRKSSKRRNVRALHSLSEQPRPHGGPEPRDVFMLWLMLLPEDANKSLAARKEIDRIDASKADSRDTLELRNLFLELATAS